MRVPPPNTLANRYLPHLETTALLRYRYMTTLFPHVYRWGRDVHCIVGVLGSLTTRMIWSYRVTGEGLVIQLLKRNPQKASGRLLCETNHASLTNKCLTAPAICTVPDPSPRQSALHDFTSSTTRHDDQMTSIHTHGISSTELGFYPFCRRKKSRLAHLVMLEQN